MEKQDMQESPDVQGLAEDLGITVDDVIDLYHGDSEETAETAQSETETVAGAESGEPAGKQGDSSDEVLVAGEEELPAAEEVESATVADYLLDDIKDKRIALPDGQVHKAEDLFKTFEYVSKVKEDLANERKQFQAESEEHSRKLAERDEFERQLNEEPTKLMLNIAQAMNPDLHRVLNDYLVNQGLHNEVEIQQASLARREEQLRQQELQRQIQAQEAEVREIEQRFREKHGVKDDREWALVQKAVPMARELHPNDPMVISRALEIVRGRTTQAQQQKPQRRVVELPNSERPGPAGSASSLDQMSEEQLWAGLDQAMSAHR